MANVTPRRDALVAAFREVVRQGEGHAVCLFPNEIDGFTLNLVKIGSSTDDRQVIAVAAKELGPCNRIAEEIRMLAAPFCDVVNLPVFLNGSLVADTNFRRFWQYVDPKNGCASVLVDGKIIEKRYNPVAGE